jgi:Flp pilus assembly protein TadG
MRQRRAESGAAVADFVLVAVLVLVVFLAAAQLGLALFTRNVLVSCASEGARYGARADVLPAQGVARARELISASLSPRYARSVTTRETRVGGVRVVEVHVVAPLPVIGLVGPEGSLDIVGRAFAERQ